MDLDVTEACNLACTYCFKWQKKAIHMDEATAKDAIDWLLEASGDFKGELKINLMGGEPTLRFDLIQKIVPYGKCRARQLGKSLHFGCTTNCTRLTDEMMDFWRRFGMGFHCSVDGIPEIQNSNRPLLGGGPSAPEVEKNVKKILSYRPEVMARATVTPRSIHVLHESALYLERLGFRSITFKMAMNCAWEESHFKIWADQLAKLGKFYIDRLVSGNPINVDEFGRGLRNLRSTRQPSKRPCGAGHALVLVDPRGDIWPCHRFGPHLCGGQFRLGKIGKRFDDRLHSVFIGYDSLVDTKADCDHCRAALTCRLWCYAECIEATTSLYNPGANYCEANRILHDAIVQIYDQLRAFHPDILQDLVKEARN
jgi:uncharacterized protein